MECTLIRDDCMNVVRQMGDKTVECVITDIPYDGVNKLGEERAKYKGQLRKIDKEEADIITFDLDEFLKEVSRVSSGGVYIFCGFSQLSQIYDYFGSQKDFMVRVCFWHKVNPSPMNGQHTYLNAVEVAVYAKRRKTKFNAMCKHNWFAYEPCQGDIEYIEFLTGKEMVYETPVGSSKRHTTEKPIELMRDIVLDVTEVGDLVVDFCAGSFSTGEAAMQTGRRFIGVELTKKWYEVGKDRLSVYIPDYEDRIE